jgi:hypothetical protein
MTITRRMPVRVCRCANVGVPSPLDPLTPTRRPMLLRSGPEEEAVMPTPLTSSRGRRPSGDANPPYVFELGPDHGRRTFDAVQSGPLKKLPVHIQDTFGARRGRLEVTALPGQRAAAGQPAPQASQ